MQGWRFRNVAKLVCDGHIEAAKQATALLVQFEEPQTPNVGDCDRLVKELGNYDSS